MAPTLVAQSTLTERYQTTVPEPVRRALRLGKHDKIHYALLPSGEIVISRSAPAEDDPVVAGFLGFLAQDMQAHPEHIQAISPGLVERIQALTRGLEVDLDAPLAPEDE